MTSPVTDPPTLPTHTADLPDWIDEMAFRRGYGTYEVALDRIGDEAYIELLTTALNLGYRHLDTAQQYDTEPHVAAAIRRSEVDADEVFVATKLHWSTLGYDDAIEAANESRDTLGVETIDLLYVHVPVGTYDPAETLPALDRLVDEGVIERIGLSNFLPWMLEDAIERLEYPVFAHQIEMHPLLQQATLHSMAVEDGHWVVAFSPYMKGLIAEIAELRAIADRHATTPHAVSLAWLLAHPNVAICSHTRSEAHLRSNRHGGLPELTADDLERITAIDREYRMWDGRIDPWNRAEWADPDGA